MTNIFCPRCQMRFYSTMTAGELRCPYCGFGFSVVEPEGRGERRTRISRHCDLFVGDSSLPADTVNVSKSGLCVRLKGPVTIGKNDTVRITVRDFDLDHQARVVWVRPLDASTCDAGLRFY